MEQFKGGNNSALISDATFRMALMQGITPLYAVFLCLLGLLFLGLIALIAIDLAKKRSRVKSSRKQSPATQFDGLAAAASDTISVASSESLSNLEAAGADTSIVSGNAHFFLEREYKSISVVARRVLEKTIQNGIGKVIMENRSFGAAARLDWIGTWLVETKGLPLYGKHPPSKSHELISRLECKRLLMIVSTNELQNGVSPREVVYYDLAVKSSDLKKRWNELVAPWS